jgi:hypothetical protein
LITQQYELVRLLARSNVVKHITFVGGAGLESMGVNLSELQELHADALPWQQILINRLEPMPRSLAGHTTVAIGH